MASDITTLCDDMQPWLAGYALGESAAAPEQLAHLAGCPHCQHALAEYRAVAGLLPYSTPEHEPPALLRARVIDGIAQAAAQQAARGAAAAPLTSAAPQWRRRWQGISRAGWAAYAFAALAVALLGWNISLRSQIADQSAQISFHRQSWQTMVALLNDNSLHWYTVAGAQARGHVWLTEGGDVACLVAQKLPPLASGQTYQVWLEQPAGEPASGGTFLAREGNGWVLVQAPTPINAYQRVFVTVEPAGGSPAPSGAPVLDGSLQGKATPAADRSELQNLLFATFDS